MTLYTYKTSYLSVVCVKYNDFMGEI